VAAFDLWRRSTIAIGSIAYIVVKDGYEYLNMLTVDPKGLIAVNEGQEMGDEDPSKA
jgi:hypothetical protein